MTTKTIDVTVAALALVTVLVAYAAIIHGPAGDSAPNIITINGERFMKTYEPICGYQYEHIGPE